MEKDKEKIEQKDFREREKIIRTFECDELLFLLDRTGTEKELAENIEIEIEIKGCLIQKEIENGR